MLCFHPACQNIDNAQGSHFCSACGAPLFLKERYWAIALLGSGGFGRTFKGIVQRNPNVQGKSCAIKQLNIPTVAPSSRQKILELFERESQWLYQLEEHPQIPKFIDYFNEADNLYLIQELILGDTLTSKIETKSAPITEIEILDFLQEVVGILKYIHQYKIIHRDLKPDNLIYRDTDKKWVLIDFGASRILSETALLGGATIIGTPEYMAPEQHRGKVVQASDLYSLGVICIELITEQTTLEMFDFQQNQWLWTKFIPTEKQLSKAFVSLINDLIAPSLGDRLKSATQVEQRIKRIRRRLKSTGLESFIPPNSGFVPKAKYINPAHQPTMPLEQPKAPNFNGKHKLAQKIQIQEPASKSIPQEIIHYQQLENYLKWRRWQAADNETWKLINKSIHKNEKKFLFPQDLPHIPCEVLLTIDQLWLKYSKERFGFSKQLEIYRQVNGKYPQFCHELGWEIVPRSRNVVADFQFKTKAPLGHLPSRQKMGGSSLWKNTEIFYEHFAHCTIDINSGGT
ncbi:serine/threonine protein kinase [[Leptolyngbya] sp. PCC 7376]|uniref:serine/threonine-protein kinase n=1 Tax=[Leptolyngbya] sp. PCC 7376 TaxID=111781 RepID=UPI00029EF0CF|nr:serine/threonine-protein kinase [[Leptolyngbya] sp. PCC 7376]AFY40246.1 serine/threonine protein kinase [[Leptolyngbya] sp. PCC 7376]